MTWRGYTVFDTTAGRCAIAWGARGIVGVQLPDAREIDTRRGLLRRFPEARESRPSPGAEQAIEIIVALLRGQASQTSDLLLDLDGVVAFNRRVYEMARMIPRGETMTVAELAKRLGASGAVHSVAQALARNPFPVLVPCHRVLAAAGDPGPACANAGVISKRRLLSLEGAGPGAAPSLFDALLVARPRPAG